MVVIIGGGSHLYSSALLKDGTGVTSVNFDLQANITRLWELGSFDPYDTSVQKQRTLSITIYGAKPDGTGGTNIQYLTPSTSCADTGSVNIEFSAVVCQTGGAVTIKDDFFITGYNYSKDYMAYGQESWSLTTKPIIDNYTGTTYMLQGIATGKMTKYVSGEGVLTGAEMGFVIDVAASLDSNGSYIEAETGSVQAGFPGIGDLDTTREVVVSQVGASTGKKDGYKGNCSCTVPVQPVYL